MKKRLLLILVMAATMICAMAIVASADDTTKEDSYWDGWVFYFTGTAEEAANLKLYAENTSGIIVQQVAISVGANDFTAIANQNVFEVDGRYESVLSVTDEANFTCGRYATAIKTTVTVEEASSEDVSFSYAVDSVLTYELYDGSPEDRPFPDGTWLEFDDPANYASLSGQSLFGNTITLKAGEKTSTGYLYYGETKVKVSKNMVNAYYGKQPIGLLIKEAGNTGKYQTSQVVWLWVPSIEDLAKGKEVKPLAVFEDKAAAQAFLDKVNNSLDVDAEKLIAAAFQYDEMTFKHGVPTADNSDLALWIALFAIATVCGGAVALKKN